MNVIQSVKLTILHNYGESVKIFISVDKILQINQHFCFCYQDFCKKNKNKKIKHEKQKNKLQQDHKLTDHN